MISPVLYNEISSTVQKGMLKIRILSIKFIMLLKINNCSICFILGSSETGAREIQRTA